MKQRPFSHVPNTLWLSGLKPHMTHFKYQRNSQHNEHTHTKATMITKNLTHLLREPTHGKVSSDFAPNNVSALLPS